MKYKGLRRILRLLMLQHRKRLGLGSDHLLSVNQSMVAMVTHRPIAHVGLEAHLHWLTISKCLRHAETFVHQQMLHHLPLSLVGCPLWQACVRESLAVGRVKRNLPLLLKAFHIALICRHGTVLLLSW